MIKVYEIHRYLNDQFQYVVARTHKYTEEKVHLDVKRMNDNVECRNEEKWC